MSPLSIPHLHLSLLFSILVIIFSGTIHEAKGCNIEDYGIRVIMGLDPRCGDVWIAVEDGWVHPTQTIGSGDIAVTSLRPRNMWTNVEKTLSSHNNKGCSAIFMAMNPNEFRRISACTTLKEAWDKLVMVHEGDSAAKESKLELLTTKFETINMEDSETFDEFFIRFGHYAHNCPKKLNKEKRKENISVTWDDSDDETELDDSQADENVNYVVFAASLGGDLEEFDKDSFVRSKLNHFESSVTDDDWAEMYSNSVAKCIKFDKTNKNLVVKLDALSAQVLSRAEKYNI
ncbi:hypothetical protein IFM89_004917 [Coptis chinensis]|uniref:Uncharacterized protein n=1 Tax=Coptis chinensis TaxID=261450 RepID=A0A835LYK1_9MAGN|nr:hypothetical protein IFM89_004917 [Coptis chinensis]